MRIEVVRPCELGPAEEKAWAELQHVPVSGRSPFLSLGFARAVDRARPAVRVAVVEDGGATTAFLPFERRTPTGGLPVGWPMSDQHGFVGRVKDARAVVKKAGLREWRFNHAPPSQPALEPYFQKMGRSPVADLTKGFDLYSTGLRSHSQVLAQTARKRRVLEREMGPVRLEWHSATREHVDRVIGWKMEQYARTGGNPLFADASALEIVEDLVRSASEECAGVVQVLFAGNRMVAGHLGLRSPDTLCLWFPAYDATLSRYSPGMVMTMEILRQAPDHGVETFDFGGGKEPYKLRFASGFYELGAGVVYGSRTEAAGRKLYRRARTTAATARRRWNTRANGRGEARRGRRPWRERSSPQP